VNSLRHLLLVGILLFAQLAAGAHAVGHAVENEKGLPTHACELCLVAHDLGTALPTLASLPPVHAPRFVPVALPVCDRSAFPPPDATQRGPPLS